ncbi:hypothetical protein LTS18_012971, partial [Coniosporium uncinatum]
MDAEKRNQVLNGNRNAMNMPFNRMNLPNGMRMPQDAMQRQAMLRNMNPQQAAQMMKMQGQRDGGGMDMGGQRPQSPSNGDAGAPSPKRQRLDNNGQPVGPAGRGQGMPGQQMGGPNGQMLLQNGIDPSNMNPQQLSAFQNQAQQNRLEVYAQNLRQHHHRPDGNNTEKGMNAAGVQGSPMAQQLRDGPGEFFAGNQIPGQGPAGQSQGNHALQDYQMQLMLLEQQNKKRLLMARQEQDNLSHNPAGSQPGMVPPGFAGAGAMSPSGSRAGPSPNPNEQMKRGTPKMGGSPMPDMAQNRGSPGPAFDPNMVHPNMNPAVYQQVMAAQQGGNMMRPPSSHPGGFPPNMTPQMMAQARQNGMPMPPNGVFPGQPGPGGQGMMPQNPGQQPVQMGTPRNTNMPPPPAPAGQEPNRTQPSSPAPSQNAPPTPSQ